MVLPYNLNRFGGGGKKAQPYYCEVEYLESTGTQYIDTMVNLKPTHKFDLRSYYGSRGSAILGCGDDTNRMGLIFGSGQTNVQFFWRTTSVSKENMAVNVSFESWATIKAEANKLTVNGTSSTWTGVTAPYISKNVLLFARTSSIGDAILYSSIKISYVKIYDGTTLVRDFIPVLDWNMVPCLYDKVSKKLFYNRGTGVFSYGREIHYVDYLESTGTQYIDTLTTMGDLSQFELETKLQTTFESDVVHVLGILLRQSSSTTSTVLRQFSINRSSTSGGKYRYSIVKDGEVTTIDTLTSNDPVEINISGVNITVNGTQYQNPFSGTLTEDTLSFYLFGWHRGNGIAPSLSQQKIYYYKIKKSGVLVRDFIPAVDQSGVGFMFDKVSHTIFGNAGTGAFNYPDVELEYLESTGTQYIDTGVQGAENLTTEFKCSFDSSISGQSTQMLGETSLSGGVVTSRYIPMFSEGANPRSLGCNTNIAGTERITYCEFNSNPHTYIFNKYPNKEVFFDGTQVGYVSETGSGGNIYIFRRNLSFSPMPTKGKFYYCNMYSSNVLIREMIPILKNGVAGMFDTVNDTFYANLGTGTFKYKIKEKR